MWKLWGLPIPPPPPSSIQAFLKIIEKGVLIFFEIASIYFFADIIKELQLFKPYYCVLTFKILIFSSFHEFVAKTFPC